MAELERRRLGRTGMTPRALGLGCAWFGSAEVSDEMAVAGIRRGIELGLDFVDTSPLYGESERRVGLALSGGWRDRVYLQTKTGTHPQRRGDYSAEATRWSVENSLRLLKTDHLDSVLIHDPSDIEDALRPGCALDELIKMKDEGFLRHIGTGVRQPEFQVRAIETGQIDIVLTYLNYTLLDQSVSRTMFPVARRHDVGVVLASALGMGLLAGPRPDPERERRMFPGPGREPLSLRMWDWCRSRGVNIRQMAIRFCLSAPVPSIAMVGPADARQVEEAVEAATAEVPGEVWREFGREFGIAKAGIDD